jgi:hypothetical protein
MRLQRCVTCVCRESFFPVWCAGQTVTEISRSIGQDPHSELQHRVHPSDGKYSLQTMDEACYACHCHRVTADVAFYASYLLLSREFVCACKKSSTPAKVAHAVIMNRTNDHHTKFHQKENSAAPPISSIHHGNADANTKVATAPFVDHESSIASNFADAKGTASFGSGVSNAPFVFTSVKSLHDSTSKRNTSVTLSYGTAQAGTARDISNDQAGSFHGGEELETAFEYGAGQATNPGNASKTNTQSNGTEGILGANDDIVAPTIDDLDMDQLMKEVNDTLANELAEVETQVKRIFKELVAFKTGTAQIASEWAPILEAERQEAARLKELQDDVNGTVQMTFSNAS